MAELKKEFETLGFENVITYLVSVKFQLAKLKKDFNVFKIRKNINNFP